LQNLITIASASRDSRGDLWPGKTLEQISAISEAMLEKGQSRVLITRISPDIAKNLGKKHSLYYNEIGK